MIIKAIQKYLAVFNLLYYISSYKIYSKFSTYVFDLLLKQKKSCGDYTNTTSSSYPVGSLTITHIRQQPLSKTATAFIYCNARRL